MAKQKRQFPEDTEVARAVAAVGGASWAAAYCDVTREAVYQWLERGFIPSARYAVLLAEAAIAKGYRASLRLLAGLDAAPAGSGPKGGRVKRYPSNSS